PSTACGRCSSATAPPTTARRTRCSSPPAPTTRATASSARFAPRRLLMPLFCRRAAASRALARAGLRRAARAAAHNPSRCPSLAADCDSRAVARPLRRAQISFAAMWAGESAFMVALGVVAFRRGGVTAVGVVTAARMACAALLAPFLATFADRVRREYVLICVGLVRAVMLGCAAAVTAADGPAAATYGLAVLATVAMTLYRPAHSALLPALAKSPQELASANAVRGMLDSVATLGGPAVAAVLLAASGPDAVFAARA